MARFRTIAVWILQVLLAALFTIQGALKLSSSPGWIARFRAWGYPDHFFVAVGAAEIFGALLLLIPKLANLGLLFLIAIMIGATATHVIHHEPQMVTTFVLLAVLSTVLYLRRT